MFEVFYFFYFKFNYVSNTTPPITDASGPLKQIRSRSAALSDDDIVINSDGKQVQPSEATLLRTSTSDSRRVLNDPKELEKRILADLNVYFDKAPDKMMHLASTEKNNIKKQKKDKKINKVRIRLGHRLHTRYLITNKRNCLIVATRTKKPKISFRKCPDEDL